MRGENCKGNISKKGFVGVMRRFPAAVALLALKSTAGSLATDPVLQLNTEFDALFEGLESGFPLGSEKLSLDPWDTFGSDGGTLTIHKRSLCPNGVGNLGFTSFNFLTFMLMTFNAVASKHTFDDFNLLLQMQLMH